MHNQAMVQDALRRLGSDQAEMASGNVRPDRTRAPLPARRPLREPHRTCRAAAGDRNHRPPPPDSPADAVDEADLSASTVAWARLLHSRKTRFTNTDRLRTRPPATTRRLRSLAAGRTFTPGPGSATRSLNASARGSTRATTRATKTSSSRSTTPTGTAA